MAGLFSVQLKSLPTITSADLERRWIMDCGCCICHMGGASELLLRQGSGKKEHVPGKPHPDSYSGTVDPPGS